MSIASLSCFPSIAVLYRYPWGEEAFEKAKKENKPIFLSGEFFVECCQQHERPLEDNRCCVTIMRRVCDFLTYVIFNFCLPAFLPVCLSVCMYVCMFVCLSVCLSVCPSLCCLSLCVCLSVCLSVCLFAYLSVCLSEKSLN